MRPNWWALRIEGEIRRHTASRVSARCIIPCRPGRREQGYQGFTLEGKPQVISRRLGLTADLISSGSRWWGSNTIDLPLLLTESANSLSWG